MQEIKNEENIALNFFTFHFCFLFPVCSINNSCFRLCIKKDFSINYFFSQYYYTFFREEKKKKEEKDKERKQKDKKNNLESKSKRSKYKESKKRDDVINCEKSIKDYENKDTAKSKSKERVEKENKEWLKERLLEEFKKQENKINIKSLDLEEKERSRLKQKNKEKRKKNEFQFSPNRINNNIKVEANNLRGKKSPCVHSSAPNITDSDLDTYTTRPATVQLDNDICKCKVDKDNYESNSKDFSFEKDIDSNEEQFCSSFGRHSQESKIITPTRNSTIPRNRSPSIHTWKYSTMPRQHSPSTLPIKPQNQFLPSSPPPYVHPKDKDCECQCECQSPYYQSHEVILFVNISLFFSLKQSVLHICVFYFNLVRNCDFRVLKGIFKNC